MRKSLILAAIIAMAATSCQKEIMQETGDLGNFSIRATREACGDANTKASINPTDGSFTWSNGDAIGIWNGNSFQKLTTQNDNAASATFTGMISGTLSNCAVYPYTIVEKSTSTSTVTLPSCYEWKEGEVASPMYAAYDASGLSFKQLGGVVMVTLNNVPATATKFVLSANKDITGDYAITSDDANKYIQSAGTENTKNEVAFTFTLTAATNMVFYVPVPVGDYIFSLKLFASDSELMSMSGTTVNSVKRKVLKKMPALTCTTISGGGEGSTSTTSIPAGHEGTFYLPDTSSDVIVNIAGDCSSVKLVYASGGAKPANVTINANEHTVGSLAIELPESHVDVVGGTYTTVTSKTSLSTLVLDETVKITDKLEVSEGSVEIACEVKDVVVNETVPVEAKIVLAPTAKITENLTTTSSAAIVIPKNTEATGSEQSQAAIKSIVVNAPTSATTDYTAPVIDLQDGATSTGITVSGTQSGNVATVESTTKTTGESSAAGEEDKTITAGTENALNYAIKNGSEVHLKADIAVNSAIRVGSMLVLDLGGHRLSATSTATYNNGTAIFVVNGANLTVKNGYLGDNEQKNFYGIYSGSTSSVVKMENVTYGLNVTYAFNGSGKFEANDSKFYGWLSGWNQGGTFTNCEFNVGKAYYAAAICYGTTTFTGCKFFKNGVNADGYNGPDSDGFYRHNYVVAACNPAENISFTGCKFINTSGAETSVTVDNHPYHDKDCPEGWGDGKAVAGTVTVDGKAVTSQCCDKPWIECVTEPKTDASGNYLITTAGELAWIAKQMRDNASANGNFKNKTFLLQNDINLYGRDWTPIGNASNPFKGCFNGQNHKILNLNIHSDNGGSEPLGLFGYVYGDNGDITGIKNLIIDGAKVISEKTSKGCGVAAGVFSGLAVADNVKVINATVKNSHYVGGIAGQAYGYFRNCTVESTKLVAYTELAGTSYDYGDKVGGIVGQFCEGSRDITNCKAINVEITGYRDLGGIAGMAHDNTTVTGCSVESVTITIDNTQNYKSYQALKDYNVNSIIGRKGSNLIDSENTGEATINYGSISTSAE